MKLIKRTTLQYTEGTSDKIYEVDICQTTAEGYVVNFRYGRRGKSLKEGEKTTQPVSLNEAQKVFDKLVQEKTKKGYQDVTSVRIQPTTSTTIDTNLRKQAILKRLENNEPSNWKLERAIWRAGELKVSEATPLLIKLIATGEALRDYCIVWALGYCGDESAIPVLRELYKKPSTPEFVKRIAFEALLKLADAPTQAELKSQIFEFLPGYLQKLARTGYAENFAATLKNYLESGDYKRFEVLDKIYQLDNTNVRPALIEILQTAPLTPNYFKYIRHIFKIAEYRHDAEVFGILVYRFDQEQENFDSYKDSVWDAVNYKYIITSLHYAKELKSPNSSKAYSKQTREYLQRRIWRTLKGWGEERDSNYIDMAVGVLLQYSDQDAKTAKQTVLYRWSNDWRRIELVSHFDIYADYITFNHIIYENSPRYELRSHAKAWRCQEGYKPGNPEPTVREEAFPELWEQHPQALLKLLQQSQCLPVHQFAIKALRVCQDFCNSLDINTIIELVQKPYATTANFALELAVSKYSSSEPNKELVMAVVNCVSENARNQAYQWIELQREYFLADSNFIVGLMLSKYEDTHTFTRKLLTSFVIADATAKVSLGRIIAELLAFTSADNSNIAKEIAETLIFSFASQLRTLGMGVINDLLAHPILEIQELGARILLNHEIDTANLPPSLIESLLASSYESLRVIGIRLFGQLPDAKLLGEDRILILAMAINASEEIRNAVQPIIRRLGTAYTTFAIQMAIDFIEILFTPENHEGVHSYLVRLLKEDCQGWTTSIDKNTALKLLKLKSSAAQELGGVLLQANLHNWVTEFSTSEIVKLANHEILIVRQAAQQMFSQILDRLRTDSQEMIAAVRILSAKWPDSREFAFNIFTHEFGTQEFTPPILVSICDSVREDARKLGRDLLMRNFQTSDGEEYLLKFSEHPSSDMQTFVTNYLEDYAGGNPEKIQHLESYFFTVLSGVNRGRIAKQQIFKFLASEADKNEQSAKIIANILTKQSLTMAIGDKAESIQIMLKIQKKYPHINVPIAVKQVVEMRT